MSDPTTYRKYASECRVRASRANNPDQKARWLEFAQQWERLAEQLQNQGPGINFEANEQRGWMMGRPGSARGGLWAGQCVISWPPMSAAVKLNLPSDRVYCIGLRHMNHSPPLPRSAG
jgi:hypothetical protein